MTEHGPDRISRFVLVELAAWLLWAAVVLPRGAHFLWDEAYGYHRAMRVARESWLPVLGWPLVGASDGARSLSAAFDLVMSVPFLVSTDPRMGAVWLMLLSVVGIAVLDIALRRCGAAPALRIAVATALCWSRWHADGSDRIWPSNLTWAWFPLALAVSLRIVDDGPRPARLLGFGVVAALGVMIHPATVLGVLCLGVLVAHQRAIFQPRRLGLVAVGFALPFLPYLVAEFASGFENTLRLFATNPDTGGGAVAVAKTALSPLLFVSQLAWFGASPIGQPDRWLTLGIGAALLAVGMARGGPLRLPALAAMVLSPLAFLVLQRPFTPHYLLAVAPLYIVLAGVGAAVLWERRPGARRALVAYAVFFVAVGVFRTTREYTSQPDLPSRPTIAAAERRVEDWIDAGAPRVAVAAEPLERMQAFVFWAVATHRYGRTPIFVLAGVEGDCRVGTGRERPPDARPIVHDTFFVCGE